MNKLTLLIVIMLGFVQLPYAQIHFKDSTEAYNYWAKRGVIEAVYAYMGDYIETVGSANAKEEAKGKEIYGDSFIEKIGSNSYLPDFGQIAKVLKENSWGGTEKALFIPLKKNFEKRILLDKNFFISYKPGSQDLVTTIPGKENRQTNWNTTTTEIIKRYNQSLSNLATGIDKGTLTNHETNPEVKKQNLHENREPKPFQWKYLIIYSCILIFGLIAGGWLIYFISKRNIYSILRAEKDSYLNASKNENSRLIFNYLSIVAILKDRKDQYKLESSHSENQGNAEVAKLKEQIAYLERRGDELLKENIELGERIDRLDLNYPVKIPDTGGNIQHGSIEKIFFSMPESDGSFQLSNKNYSNDGKKYFKIEFKEPSNRGELFFLPSRRDQKAINRLESYLKPVCDIENIANASSATKIELIRSGKVILNNDRWVIDPENKIKIKLY